MNSSRSFAGRFYRAIARHVGRRLGESSQIVESVFVHRSAATGDVSFGRSDIDVVVIVRQPVSQSADGPEMTALFRSTELQRRFNPLVRHMAVQDPKGFLSWREVDTYMGSLDRRSSLWVYGSALEPASVPVRREDAIRRFAYWHERYLARSLRHNDLRGIGKIAADAWNTYCVAIGRLEEPFLTRSEAEADWQACHEEMLAEDDYRAGQVRGFALAKILHDRLFPKLDTLGEPMVFKACPAPFYRERVYGVVPGPASLLPRTLLEKCSSVVTPELLRLYLNYVNPFLYSEMPEQLRRIGISIPGPDAYLRACGYLGHSHMTRNPGFMHRDTAVPTISLAVLRHCVLHLQAGRIPPPLGQQDVSDLLAHRPSIADYYRRDFPAVYWECEELWNQVRQIEATGLTHAAAGVF